MGYCRSPTLTTLGVLREAGTPEDQQDEGLGAFGIGARLRAMRERALAASAPRTSEPRPSRVGFQPSPAPTRRGFFGRIGQRVMARRRLAMREAPPVIPSTRRRFGMLRDVARQRLDRATALEAERKAAEAIAELHESAITPPPAGTDRGPLVGTALACVGPPPDRRVGWHCFSGQWRYRSPFGNGRTKPPTERTMEPSVRPWWMGRAPDGEIPARDTSGIATPPGLPGGPTMRPPPSEDDTATERVTPAEAPDMAKLLPVGLGLAALMFMGG